MKFSATVAIGLVLMVIGLLLMTAGVTFLALAPRMFEATARVLVEPVSATNAGVVTRDSAWWQSELERARSTTVLRSAITNLQLRQSWATQQKRETPLAIEEAELELRKRLDLQLGRGTTLLSFTLRAFDGGEAASLANGVAEAFRQSHAADPVKVELVDAATAPTQPIRRKQPMAVILFLGGAAMMLAGYVMLRPHLDKIGGAPVLRP